MTPYHEQPDVTLYQGDARDLSALADESVQCCVTSPPYWGLRDYGVADQIGLEPTPAEFVANMVKVFREVRRVLRNDGTLWLNLGDSYATGAGRVGNCPGGGEQGERWKGYRGTREGSPKHSGGAMGPMTQPNRMPQEGLKPKDLVGVPWRVAFALQADGWYLRADIIWHKPNPMPESVEDRPTKAHEYLFLLTKSDRYYYDHEAIKEDSVDPESFEGRRASGYASRFLETGQDLARTRAGFGKIEPGKTYPKRNARSVWTIAVNSYAGAHFATFPPTLPERCILAGSKPGDLVLDPFNGSGTTGEVARKWGRRYAGLDLNPEYLALSAQRFAQGVLFPAEVASCG